MNLGLKSAGILICKRISINLKFRANSIEMYIWCTGLKGSSASFWRHQDRQGHADEFVVVIEWVQGAAYMVGDVG